MERLYETGRAERIAMEIRRAAAIEEGYRAHRRFLIKGVCVCLFWDALGVLMLLTSFHLTNQRYADLLFQLSFVVGYGGMFFTAIGFWVRGREIGEFD